MTDDKKDYWTEYFENVSYSWMENWLNDLRHLTMRTASMTITLHEADELLKLLDGDAEIPPSFMDKLMQAFVVLDRPKAFVRLGSRSPKDNKTDVTKITDVISCFADSARIAEDLLLCINMKYEPHLFLREWIDIPRTHEFRCFVKDGELRGISQYFYREKYHYLDNESIRDDITSKTRILLDEIQKKFKRKNFVFDIMYRKNQLPLLIEINPWSDWSVACLFDWVKDKFETFEFKWLQRL